MHFARIWNRRHDNACSYLSFRKEYDRNLIRKVKSSFFPWITSSSDSFDHALYDWYIVNVTKWIPFSGIQLKYHFFVLYYIISEKRLFSFLTLERKKCQQEIPLIIYVSDIFNLRHARQTKAFKWLFAARFVEQHKKVTFKSP